jgi:hypothetical protein
MPRRKTPSRSPKTPIKSPGKTPIKSPSKPRPSKRGRPTDAGKPRRIASTGPRQRGDSRATELTGIQKRLKEIELEKARLESRKARIAPVIRPQPFPTRGIEKRRGSVYTTWFKAQGLMGKGGRGWDEYERMKYALDDIEVDSNAPGAFYSHHILGRIKWPGIVPVEELILRLNDVGGWEGDFRDIYDNWSYEYQVVESIGGTPIRIWTETDGN